MKVTCYASGVIGTSWATNFALKGCTVTVYDLNQELLDHAKKLIRSNLLYLEAEDCLRGESVEAVMERVTFTDDVEAALREAEFIQESGPERLELKQTFVALFDRLAPAACIVASSTSGLRISDITAKSTHPERYIGAHPFNPPHLIPLVELTKGDQTSPETVNRALGFYRLMGKEPIVLQKEKAGFVANRISHSVLREVMSLVNEGVCSVEDVDKALTYGPGLRWAAVGQVMVGELGTSGGIREGTLRFKALNESIFRDLENRTEVPEHWEDTAEAGITEEKAHMPDCIGHTTDEIAQFRDKVLVSLLKLHGKL
ncbi:MAG: 3-hydroxyacyl-CoA dehydrogenase NAD-binding domain-containing protein [Oscillospiraceae bacterium]|nr:3-hydroxyacyl-CoA dehydrogenase NAD-binding domain-containing protein [Oscillospiraceae bacterium]